MPITDLSLKRFVRKGDPTDKVTKEWFKNLNRSQVLGLYKAYQPDFELFDYSIEPYLSLAQYKEA